MSIGSTLFSLATPRVEGISAPEGQPAVLRSAARTFVAAADTVDAQVRAAEAAAVTLVPSGWFGLAALSFRSSAAASADDLRVAGTAFREAAATLESLAQELEAAQEAASRAEAAAADLNARSARLDQQYQEAQPAQARLPDGADMGPSPIPGLVAQAGGLQFEAAGIRAQAAAAAEQARAAAARAAAAFGEIAAMAPSIQRAARTLSAGSADDPAWDPIDSLREGDPGQWWQLVWGRGRCPTGPGTYGGAGSFILGPDGLLYPLVVPRLTIDGVVYSGSRGTLPPNEHVSTLGGMDPGWTSIYRMEGITRLQDPPSTIEKIFIGFAGTNPNLRPATAPFGEDDYGLLAIGASGIPFIHAERQATRPADVPPVQIHTVAPGWAMVDGELVMVDRNAPETWNREIRRSGITPNTGVQRANAAAGAVDLANQALEGINLAQMSEDYGTSAYQVVFEANEDGRRRAVLRTYQVRVDQDSGEYLINPSHGYVGEDGGPAFDNILYRQGDEIRPADQPYAVVQYEDEKLGD